MHCDLLTRQRELCPFHGLIKALFRWLPCYPAIRSMRGILSLLLLFHFVRLRVSQSWLYRSAWNFTWRFGHISDRSSIVGDSPRYYRVLDVTRDHMAGYASCWSPTANKSRIAQKVCFVAFLHQMGFLTMWVRGELSWGFRPQGQHVIFWHRIISRLKWNNFLTVQVSCIGPITCEWNFDVSLSSERNHFNPVVPRA